MSSLLRSIIMSASCVWAVFFIALLIDCPTDVGGDLIGDPSDRSDGPNDTWDAGVLNGVVTRSGSDSGTPLAATPAYESAVVPVIREDCNDPQFGTDSCRLLRSRAKAVTVLCNCLISFLYSFSFSSIRSRCLITSLIVGATGVLSLSCTLGAWLPRDGDSSITLSLCVPFFSELLVVILVADGEGFFLGVASADAESESLVNRLSRLGGLPSTPPCGPSLFLFSTCSLSLIN
jgi:hypothetical protein